MYRFSNVLDLLGLRILDQPMSLKVSPHDVTNILRIMKFAEKFLKFEQLRVTRIIKPRFNRDAIVNLISECMGTVVNEDGFAQVSSENIQVFEKITFDGKAGVAKHSVADKFPLYNWLVVRYFWTFAET